MVKVGGPGPPSSAPASARPSVSVIGILLAPATTSLDQTPRREEDDHDDADDLGLSPSGSKIELVSSDEKQVSPAPRSPWDTRHEFAKIDKIFMIVFPVTFGLFNIFYWAICVQFQDIFK